MGDKASIILRYDIKSNTISDRIFKGVICNHYRGYDPQGLVIRAALGLAYFMNHQGDLRRISGPIERDLTYQTFRRVFDVDFVNRELCVSIDGVEDAKKKFSTGEIEKDKFTDAVMWQDTDFGQLLVNITGTEGTAVAKYAFVKNIYDIEEHYTTEEYLKWNKVDSGEQDVAAVKGIDEYATSMTDEDIKSFVGTSIYEYAYYNELQRKNTQCIKETVTDEDPIEELELSVRAYNSLKKAGVDTVGQLRSMSEEELLSCRNMGRKNVDEIQGMLNKIS